MFIKKPCDTFFCSTRCCRGSVNKGRPNHKKGVPSREEMSGTGTQASCDVPLYAGVARVPRRAAHWRPRLQRMRFLPPPKASQPGGGGSR
eukprot:gene10429-biopygen15331